MKSFEDELRSSLRRVEPLAGFTERLLSRIAAEPAPKVGGKRPLLSWLKPPKLCWVAASIALAVVLAVIGVVRYRRYERQRAEGELARVRVLLALEIASSKLNVALKHVERVDHQAPSSQAKPKSTGRTEHL